MVTQVLVNVLMKQVKEEAGECERVWPALLLPLTINPATSLCMPYALLSLPYKQEQELSFKTLAPACMLG